MKKSLVALAALAASAAFAQSAVSISGVMDLGLKNVSKAATGVAKTSIGAGNNSRIAFSVTEDLGGGLKALANAQLRFDPTTGGTEASGTRPLFQGETRLGLSGSFGTVMMGRGLTPLQAANGMSDPWGVSTVAGSVYAPGFATDYAAGGEGRIDQAVFYTAPAFAGVTLSASYSPRKVVTAGVASKTHQSLNALYAAGAFTAGVGQERNRANDQITQAYGSYDLGVVKLIASLARINGGTAADQAAAGTFAAAASAVNSGNGAVGPVAAEGEINARTIGAVMPLGALSLRAGYSQWNGNGADGQKNDTKFGLGARYDLSKRTYLYTDLASQTRKNNTGTAADGKDNTNVTSMDVGVAHSF